MDGTGSPSLRSCRTYRLIARARCVNTSAGVSSGVVTNLLPSRRTATRPRASDASCAGIWGDRCGALRTLAVGHGGARLGFDPKQPRQRLTQLKPSTRTGRPPRSLTCPAQRPACVCGSKLPAAAGSAAAPHHGVTGPLPSRSLAEEGRAMPAPARLARSCLRPGRPGGTSFPAVTPTTRIGERPRRARQSARPDDTPIEHVYDRGGPEARTRRHPGTPPLYDPSSAAKLLGYLSPIHRKTTMRQTTTGGR